MNFGVLHMTDPIRALAEARRVLSSGGRLGFTVWSKPEECPAAKVMVAAIEKHGDLTVRLPEGPPKDLLADEARCLQAFDVAGFAPASMSFDTRAADWIVETPGFYFEAERDAGVRTAALLACQTPERLAAIKAEVERGVARFRWGNAYALPMTAHIVTASRD